MVECSAVLRQVTMYVQVLVDVTKEERDKLRKLRQELRSAFHGRPVLCLKLTWQNI